MEVPFFCCVGWGLCYHISVFFILILIYFLLTEASMSQRGNVLFLILIAVALFAALSYAVTKSSSGGGSIAQETLMFRAQRFVDFGDRVRVGVLRMSVSQGIDIETIDFGQNATGTNALFAPEGGGVAWMDPPQESYDGAGPYSWNFEKPSNNWGASGVGTDVSGSGGEAFIWIYNIDYDVCAAINKLLGMAQDVPVDNTTGTLSGGNTMGVTPGEWAFCYKEGSQAPEFIYILEAN